MDLVFSLALETVVVGALYVEGRDGIRVDIEVEIVGASLVGVSDESATQVAIGAARVGRALLPVEQVGAHHVLGDQSADEPGLQGVEATGHGLGRQPRLAGEAAGAADPLTDTDHRNATILGERLRILRVQAGGEQVLLTRRQAAKEIADLTGRGLVVRAAGRLGAQDVGRVVDEERATALQLLVRVPQSFAGQGVGVVDLVWVGEEAVEGLG